MKVKALKSFADGRYGVIHKGSEVEMPDDADWVDAGLVETAAVKGGEPRDTSTGRQPVTAVHGIGPATAAELEEYGVETVADLAAADLPEDYDEWRAAAQEMLRD